MIIVIATMKITATIPVTELTAYTVMFPEELCPFFPKIEIFVVVVAYFESPEFVPLFVGVVMLAGYSLLVEIFGVVFGSVFVSIFDVVVDLVVTVVVFCVVMAEVVVWGIAARTNGSMVLLFYQPFTFPTFTALNFYKKTKVWCWWLILKF